jgi:hypothetical protein
MLGPVDTRVAHRICIVRMLTWANDHVYAQDSVVVAARWFVQHLVAPQVILFGEPHRNEQEITQLLFREVCHENVLIKQVPTKGLHGQELPIDRSVTLITRGTLVWNNDESLPSGAHSNNIANGLRQAGRRVNWHAGNEFSNHRQECGTERSCEMRDLTIRHRYVFPASGEK